MPASNPRGGACWFWSHSSKLSKHPGVEDVLLSGVVVAAIVVVAWPARSQSSTTHGAIDSAECAGHRSFQPGVSGLLGSKSGPTVTRSGTTGPKQPGASRGSEQGSRTPRQQIRADGQTVGCQVSGPALETGSARNLGRRKAEPAAAASALCWSMVGLGRVSTLPVPCRRKAFK